MVRRQRELITFIYFFMRKRRPAFAGRSFFARPSRRMRIQPSETEQMHALLRPQHESSLLHSQHDSDRSFLLSSFPPKPRQAAS
jgi:hypothetical protein